MRRLARYSVLATAALAVGCGFNPLARKATTIESLKKTSVHVPETSAVSADRERAIEAYQGFLDLDGGDPRLRAEALRRLADLLLEEDEARLSDDNPSLAAGTGAAALYRTLLDEHPEGADNDRVLYQLARAHEINGDGDSALKALEQLVTSFTDSPYLTEAWFRIGELHFVNTRYNEASVAFAQVLDAGSATAFYGQALYKHGWSLFKQSRHAECVESFVSLVALSLPASGELDAAELSRAERELLDDALRAMSISFSYDGGPDAVTAFLDGSEPLAFEDLLYARLGDLYLEQKRYSDAADAFEGFVNRQPVHPRAPLLSSRVIDAYAAGGFAGQVLDAKQAFAERYALNGDFWVGREPADHEAVMAALKSHLADLANHWHAVAQTSGEASDYNAAIHWYRTTLDSFPNDDDAPSNSFLLAELLHDSGDLAAATSQFERTAYEFEAHPQAAAAGYAALLSYAELQEAPGVQGTDAQSQWRDLHIDSSLRFATVFSDDPRANAVRVFAAEALFADGELAAAIDAAAPVTQTAQDPELLRTAWTVTGHSQFERSAFAEAEIAYLELRALGARSDAERIALDERLAATIYKQAEVARDAGDATLAVQHFLRVGTTAPGTAAHPVADFDAAAVLMGAGDWAAALPLLSAFADRHDGHPLGEQVEARLALSLEKTGRPAEAAAVYQRIADSETNPAERRATLWHITELYSQAGNDDASASVLTTLAAAPGASLDERMDAQAQLVELARKQGDTSEELRWLTAQVEADRKAGETRTDRSRALAADASMALALPIVERYRDVTLTVPLKESLREKKARLETALAALNATAGYSVQSVTTHAGYLVAELYFDFSQALMNSERPPGLDELALEEYELLLEEQAFPFEEKAIDIHRLNADRTADGIYDQWVKDSFTRLAQLLPVRYAKTEVSDGLIERLD